MSQNIKKKNNKFRFLESGKSYGNVVSTSIWDFIIQSLKNGGSLQLRNSITQIQKLQNIQTAEGLGRAWIRYIFNNSILLSSFEVLLGTKDLQTKLVKKNKQKNTKIYSFIVGMLHMLLWCLLNRQ